MEMAYNSIYNTDSFSLFYFSNFISNTSIMDINFQNILVVTSVVLAVIYLFKKFSPKKSTHENIDLEIISNIFKNIACDCVFSCIF